MRRPWQRQRGQHARGVTGGDKNADSASHGLGMKLSTQSVKAIEVRNKGRSQVILTHQDADLRINHGGWGA